MKTKILIILFVFASLLVHCEENAPKLILLNKETIQEDIKEIKNSNIILQSGVVYKTEDAQEILIKDKTEIGLLPILLLNNGSMIYTSDLILTNNVFAYKMLEIELKTSCDLVNGVLFKNLSNENSVIWKKHFLSTQRKSDLIFVLKEDKLISIEAVIGDIDKDKIKLHWDGQDKTISLDKVIGILFASVSNEQDYNYEITCIDGSRFRFDFLSLDAEGICKAYLSEDKELLKISSTNIHRIVFNNHKVVFLSNLEPIEESSKGFLISYLKNWEKNQNIWKKPMFIAGKSYQNGIGMHSTCQLKFLIPKGSVQFISDYGIDDCVVNRSGCIFKILVDKKQFLNESLSSLSGVKTIIIDLPVESKEISLIIEPGLNLDVGDLGVWGSARFIKK